MAVEDDKQDDPQNKDDQQRQQRVPDTSVEKLVEQRVADALKDIKGKLDKAYEARDEANRKAAELEQKQKEADLQRMEEEGKKLEALQIRYDELLAKNTVLENRITELTRDNEVTAALSGLPFRNEKAMKIAQKEIIESLVRNDKGLWVHKSGVSIKDAIEAFSKDEDQSFLFKPKQSSGGGTGKANDPSGDNQKPGSLFAMSQEDVLRMAREGKLRK